MEIQKEISDLEIKLSKAESFEEKLEIKDKIHNLKLQSSGIKPLGSSQIECVGCGS